MKKTKKETLRTICEGGLSVSLALALSYLKIPLGVQGGSVDIVMVPIIIYALRRGIIPGTIAGFSLGTIKYFIAEGFAVSWQSILFDYSGAYMVLGFAAVACIVIGEEKTAIRGIVGALIGGICRFAVHFASGVTIYAMYMPEEFLGLEMNVPAVYSILYNGVYMIPNIIAAMVLTPLIMMAMRRAKV